MSKNKNKVSKGRGWKFGAIATAGTLTVVTATLAGVGAIALNVLPTKPKDLRNIEGGIKYVALGDGLTSGANMLVGEDYVSFADFLASDLKNANKLGSYENFADSSNKIFDVLNGALMNGAQREAIKNADLITITAGTNDLLAMMELFGVPLASLSTEEERNRGGLNTVTSLDDQYADRQDKMVSLLTSMGNAIKNKDFSGAISIDENVFEDLFLAVNLNLTLLTTEIAKIAPGAKIVLLSPFNPVEGLPTSLTNAPLGNGGMSFNQLFAKLIDTYDTVDMLNPAVEHINMNEISAFGNNHDPISLYKYTDRTGSSFEVTKERKRFNDIDMNPSVYGHQLIGNGLFEMLSDDLGIAQYNNFISTGIVADQDLDKEIENNGVFAPEFYDESNNGNLEYIKGSFAITEQILEALDTLKFGSKEDDSFIVTRNGLYGDINSINDPFEWVSKQLVAPILKVQMNNNSPITALIANVQLLFMSLTQAENDALSDSLFGQLRFDSNEALLADKLLQSIEGVTLNGKSKTIRNGNTEITVGNKTISANEEVNLESVFGVQNVAQFYGMYHLTHWITEIYAKYDAFVVKNYSWMGIARTSITPPNNSSNAGNGLTQTTPFAYTSPLFIATHSGSEELINRLKQLSVDQETDLDLELLETQLNSLIALQTNADSETVPTFLKPLVEDIFGVVTVKTTPTGQPDPLGSIEEHLVDGQSYKTIENSLKTPQNQWPSSDDIDPLINKVWYDHAVVYANTVGSKYGEVVKFINMCNSSAIEVKRIMFGA